MSKRNHLPGGGDSVFRLWPAISLSDLRRKLLDFVTCGVSHHRPRRRRRKNKNAVPFPRPDRLSELLKLDISSDSGSESEKSSSSSSITSSIVEPSEELMELVAEGLRSECAEKRKEAAAEVRRLAKDNADARETIARLGAIPPLVALIDTDGVEARISSLYALLNLGIGNEMNKAAIVKEGAIHKMLSLVASEDIEPRVSEAVVANLLGLSAIDSNKPIIGASPGAIQFLVNSFLSGSGQSRQDALRALFNLSLSPPNSHPLLQCNIVHVLLSSIGVGGRQVSERCLATLSNLVSSSETRKCIARSRDALPILVDTLGWLDAPICQEHSSYVLMVLARKSSAAGRAAMIEAGMNTPLLELALVGTALAQKRASRVLEILRVDKEKQVSEGFGRSGFSSVPQSDAASEGRRAVTELVNESLRGNMRRIIRRANMPADSFAAGAISAPAAGAGGSSSSKSLTF